MKRFLAIAVQCLVILAIGLAAMLVLAMMREEPARMAPEPQPLLVQTMTLEPQTIEVLVNGYGTARPVNVVTVMPEVRGVVTEVHPDLDPGEVIPAGEVLFRIDDRTYKAQLAEAEAMVGQAEQSLESIEVRSGSDRARLETLRRSEELARADYERMRKLFEEERVGAQVTVEQLEQAYNQTKDQVDQLRQAVKLSPGLIEEAESAVQSAQARLEQARIALENTVVRAPFDARIKTKMVQLHQFVAPGTPALVIADDSVLEISVPLDSRQARQWLRFEENPNADTAWFGGLEAVTCEIRWTEDDERVWQGVLDRVERFDEQNRTLTVAVRITAEQILEASGSVPLVDGMFCEVRIPGRNLSGVFLIPPSAVTFEGQAYIARDGKLETAAVTVAHEQEGMAVVTEGLEPGMELITTRLVAPQEGTPLRIAEPEQAVEAATL